ncbi:MAG: hypothetical protein EOO40_08025, partial [Deltaproteobacteria bacterium]
CCGTAPSSTLQETHSTTPSQSLAVARGQLVDGSGKTVSLHGFNWFGFNNGGTMVDGVWGGPAVGLDFATVAYRQQLLGFNAVRLPFSFKDLLNLTPRNFTQDCTLPSKQDVAKSVLSASQSLPSSIPDQVAPPIRPTGRCNDYLPNDSVWNRYKWVVNFYTHNGFYVLVDNHFREDQSALEDSNAWATNWARLVAELAEDPITKSHMFVDLLNEPDNYGLRWEAANGKPGLADLYIKAMDAIQAVAPGTVFFTEGTGQGGLQANWGDGFATDPRAVQSMGLSDASPFFKAVLSKGYAAQVVMAPHVYGPAVSTNTRDATGEGLFNRLSTSFGYLTKQGFCSGNTCHRFPVAVGEFGSKFTEANDVAAMKDISTYLRNTGDAADGRHTAIDAWFYWSWNANSGDTGGLIGDDWVTLQWTKLNYLKELGLKPFSNAGGTGLPSSTPAPTP